MYLMYVDESGDCGLVNSPTRYFVLSGLIVHELRWHTYLDELINFRRFLKQNFGLKLREEFHAASFITRPKELVRIKRYDRLTMMRLYANKLAALPALSLINIVVDKQGKASGYDVFEMAWKTLIQRFENTISNRNFPGPANPDERGFLLCDHTDDKKLTKLLRKMRQYNPIPNAHYYGGGYRNLPITYIIEDPCFRDSGHSYFIQSVDLASYLLQQHLNPNAYMRKNSGQNYFGRLKTILCLSASSSDPYGIVRI